MDFLREIEIALQNKEAFTLFFFIIGACLGSFFNVIAFRYPIILLSQNANEISQWLEEHNLESPKGLDVFKKEINLSYPSSHCYSCKNPLKWYHNIPILSYLLLKGKCGFCGTPYSIQYPLVELASGLILAFVYQHFFFNYGLNIFLLSSIFFSITYLLLIVDTKTLMLPDEFNYSLLWIGVIFSTFGISILNIDLSTSIYGLTVGFSILWLFAFLGKKIKGIDVMGDGDLKLIAALGVFVGIKGVIFTIFFSPTIGIATWLIFKLKGTKEPEFPYGPSLILSSWIYIFYGNNILTYLDIPI